jgi:serine/threonine protein kinase
MELVDGGSLSDLMGVGPMPVDRAVEIAIQAAGALVEAHSCRIVHRDIKPWNIRLDRHGAIKIVDFGLAKTLTEQPVGKRGTGADTEIVEGMVAGTPRYTSPEQALGKLSVNFKLKSEKTGQTLLVGTDQDRRNLRLEIADPKGKKFAGFFAPPRGRERGKKLLTRKTPRSRGSPTRSAKAE